MQYLGNGIGLGCLCSLLLSLKDPSLVAEIGRVPGLLVEEVV